MHLHQDSSGWKIEGAFDSLVAVDEVDPEALLSVMYTEHAIQVWSSLVSRLPLLSLSETQVLVVFLNTCTNHRKDFLTPRNAEKKVSNIYSNFRFPANPLA